MRYTRFVVSMLALIGLVSALYASGQKPMKGGKMHGMGNGMQSMMMRRNKMRAEMQAGDVKLKALAAEMNRSKGNAKINAIAATVNELVSLRLQMHSQMGGMMKMMSGKGGMMKMNRK